MIYLSKSPADLHQLVSLDMLSLRRQFCAVWIIDSFWTEWAPSKQVMRHFDLVAYTHKGDAEFYERLVPGRSRYLPWGTDALDLGSASGQRSVDVLRVGRQPDEWEHDAHSLTMCAKAGLQFSGRPPFVPDTSADPSAGHKALTGHYADTKFVIAHSNLVAPGPNTHPKKEYLTARWLDALAAGATVSGVHPYTDASSEDLLWPGATLDFDRVDLQHNVETLRDAVQAWTPEIAQEHHQQALRRLDWRWRFNSLGEALSLKSPKLEADLRRLQDKLSVL